MSPAPNSIRRHLHAISALLVHPLLLFSDAYDSQGHRKHFSELFAADQDQRISTSNYVLQERQRLAAAARACFRRLKE